MECAECGTVVPPGRRACIACGTPVMRSTRTSPMESVDALLAEANLLRTRGQHDEAIGVCTRILRQEPTNAAAHSLLANIYRDQSNYREALGWFKLAVELDPDNATDKQRLDEMIDLVFQGALSEGGRPVRSRPLTPTTPLPRRRSPMKPGGTTLQQLLARIQPTHVVIATTILSVCVMLFFVLADRRHRTALPAPDTYAQPSGRTAVEPGDAENATGTAVATTTPAMQVTPPPADVTENGGIPGLPGIIVRPGRPTDDGKSSTPPPATANTNTTLPANADPPSGTQVPPFQPSASSEAQEAEQIDHKTRVLRVLLENKLATSKLPAATLQGLQIDPRFNTLTIEYTIPRMKSPTETKQGLLYTGLHLIWEAIEQNKSLTLFTLRGYAFPSADASVVSLAMAADVTPEQAKYARSATDYRTVVGFLSKPWWRADIDRVPL